MSSTGLCVAALQQNPVSLDRNQLSERMNTTMAPAVARSRWLAISAGAVTILAAGYEHRWLDVAFWASFVSFFSVVLPTSGAAEQSSGRLLAMRVLVVLLFALAVGRIAIRLRSGTP